jgi:hypothetical protein
MDRQKEQQLLLETVETWNLNEYPEFRGFRCANCQQYKNQAWYHWLNSGDYRLPVHMCDDNCESLFKTGAIEIDENKKVSVDRNSFGNSYQFKPETIKRFDKVIASWPEEKEPELKNFSCDECGLDLEINPVDNQRKGFHVWYKMLDGKTLAELHFHKNCANALGIE